MRTKLSVPLFPSVDRPRPASVLSGALTSLSSFLIFRPLQRSLKQGPPCRGRDGAYFKGRSVKVNYGKLAGSVEEQFFFTIHSEEA